MARTKQPAVSNSGHAYWFTGNHYDVESAYKQLVKELKPGLIDIVVCTESADDTDIGPGSEVSSLMKMLPIDCDGVRLIKMIGVPSDYDKITQSLDLLRSDSVFVVLGPLGYKSKGANSRFVNIEKTKFFTKFKAVGVVKEFPEEASTPHEATEWLLRVSKELGKPIKEDAADKMISMRGMNYDTLYVDLMKLVSYSETPKITTDDVAACCEPIYQTEIWPLLDALDDMNFSSSMSILKEYLDSQINSQNKTLYGVIQSILFVLHKHYLFLLMVKDSCGDKLHYDNAKQAMDEIKTKSKAKSDTNEQEFINFFDGRYISVNFRKEQVARAIKRRQSIIYGCLRDILRCACACRYNSSSEPVLQAILNATIMALCGNSFGQKLLEDFASRPFGGNT